MALHDLTPQLRTRLRRMEKIVGLFVLVAAVLLVSGFAYYLYHTAERKGWFTPKCPYYTFVQSADGLHVGDPVLLMGFSVGEITVIEAEPPNSSYNVFVAFEIKQPYYGYIWTDSRARITGGGLLGGRQLEVTKGRNGMPTAYEEDGRVATVLVEGQRVALASRRQGVPLDPEEAPALAARAEQLLGKLEQDLPRITSRLETVLANSERLSANLDQLVGSARPVVANLGVITRNLRNPRGALGEWLIPSDLRTQIEATLHDVSGNLSVLGSTLRNVDAISGGIRAELDANRNVVGEISDLVRDTDDLVQGLKRHWLLRSAFPRREPGADALRTEPLREAPAQGAP